MKTESVLMVSRGVLLFRWCLHLSRMKVRAKVSVIFLLVGMHGMEVFAASPTEAPTHCVASEYTYFSCRLRGSKTVISLCGSAVNPQSEDADMLLDYRSGPFGKVNIRFPETPVSAKSGIFLGTYLKPYGEAMVLESIQFSNKGVFRVLTDMDGGRKFVGLNTRVGKNEREYRCLSNATNSAMQSLILRYLPQAPRS